MLVLGQHGIITFTLPAFAAAHCFGPAVLPRFCCYHVWPVGQPFEDLCSYVACDSPSLRCQVNVKSSCYLPSFVRKPSFCWKSKGELGWNSEINDHRNPSLIFVEMKFVHFPEIPPRFLQAIVAYLFVSRRQVWETLPLYNRESIGSSNMPASHLMLSHFLKTVLKIIVENSFPKQVYFQLS